MSVPKRKARSTKKSPRRTPPRHLSKARPKSVLILQCNADKLEGQKFSFSGNLEKNLRAFVPAAVVHRVRATTRQDLLIRLAECQQKHGTFDIIAVETHSNQRGLELAADCRPTWEQFSAWLTLFEPRFLILVGCQAGRWLPSRDMFSGLPSLQQLYGSPLLTTEQQAAAFHVLIPTLLLNGRVSKDWRQLMQLAQFATNGGVIFYHTRRDFQRKDLLEPIMWTGIESLLRQMFRR